MDTDQRRSLAEDFMLEGSDDSSDGESGASGSKRNARPVHNIGQACKFCKKRHIRCDGVFPCTQCVKRNLQCTFGTKTKRGPKPKTDLYEHCNKLMVDLEVQKQIAEYWREQFMTAMRKHGKDGTEFVEEHGLHPPVGAMDLERTTASDGISTPSSMTSTPNNQLQLMKAENSMLNFPSPHSSSSLTQTVGTSSSMTIDQTPSSSPSPYIPQVTQRDPKPELTIEQLSNMFTLFSCHVQPLVPDYVIVFSAESCLEVWNSTKAERDEIMDRAHLTDLFEHAVTAAHGFRLAANPDVMHRFAKKAEDLLQLLFFQREAQCHSELAQRLVQVLILLSFYYAGDDRDGSKQSVIMLAYQIISMHRTHIVPATMHRVYYTMMSLSENQADRVYWFNQASSLATQMKIKSLASVTAASMMFIFSSLHPKANFDQAPPSFTKPQLYAFLKKIDDASNFFTTTNTTVDGMPLSQEAVSTFSVLMTGCRSELLFLLGEFKDAMQASAWTIKAGAALQRPVHISMFGVQCAAEVSLAMHMTSETQLALATFEKHSRALPITNRFRRRLMSQINLQRVPAGAEIGDEDAEDMVISTASSSSSVSSTGGAGVGTGSSHSPMHSIVTTPGGGGAVASSSSATNRGGPVATAGNLSASTDILQTDYMHGGLMNEDMGYGTAVGIHQLPTTDPHFGTQPTALKTPRQFRPIQPLRMSGSVPGDDPLMMYSEDYPTFS